MLFLKNEATDLIENKGSAADEMSNEATAGNQGFGVRDSRRSFTLTRRTPRKAYVARMRWGKRVARGCQPIADV